MAPDVKTRKINETGTKTRTVAPIEQEYDADLPERLIAGIDDFVAAATVTKAAL